MCFGTVGEPTIGFLIESSKPSSLLIANASHVFFFSCRPCFSELNVVWKLQGKGNNWYKAIKI